MRSMSKMQKLGPKMQALKEHFADDKQRLQEETMKLYRSEGVNPVGGCLPMFLQMPVWFGLYGALLTAIALRHAPFLPTWMVPDGSLFLQDMSQPDALIHWAEPVDLPGRSIPLLGWLIGVIQNNLLGGRLMSFNILPFLMAGTMWLQQRFTPSTATGPQAEQQKKMMSFMMVFLLLVLYNAPAGLCLYIFTSSLLGFFENRYLRAKFAAEEDDGDASVPAAPVPKGSGKPGKPPRKKPRPSGRHRSPAERIQAWAKKRIAARQKKDRD
jgi:YidC/Oxa1 family membrane protein insertase